MINQISATSITFINQNLYGLLTLIIQKM